MKTSRHDHLFYKTGSGVGSFDWIAPGTFRVLILKVKICKPFSEFVKIPASFESVPKSFLFDKLSSNFSFNVENEVVYAIFRILTSVATTFERCWRVLSRKLKCQ
jgi:hypothetical protein